MQGVDLVKHTAAATACMHNPAVHPRRCIATRRHTDCGTVTVAECKHLTIQCSISLYAVCRQCTLVNADTERDNMQMPL
jgi:hypothetical protein